MASWQETYEQLKKKKKQIDNAKSTSEINKINTAYNNNKGKVSLPTYTNNNQLPSLPTLPTIKTTVPMPTTKKKEEEKKWYQKIFTKGEFDDGYDFGDVTKTILGTATDISKNIGEGILGVAEVPVDIASNVVATGFNIFGQKETAENIRDFADLNLSKNLSKVAGNVNPTGMLYNAINGDFEKIINPGDVEWDKDKNIVENYKDNFSRIWLDENKAEENYEKSSISGHYADEVTKLVGYSLALMYGGGALSGATKTANIGTKTAGITANAGNIGLRLAGKTLNVPTLAIAGGMSSGLQEANSKEDVTELERWTKGVSSGLIEGLTEGMFGFFGKPGTGGITNEAGEEIFDKFGQKFAEKFSSRAGKTLANIGIKSLGEPIEEFTSYALNYFVDNNLIDKMGDADFSQKWDWGEVGEQMALAYASALITQGGGNIIANNTAIAEAEKQLGRKLTPQEKAEVTQASINGTLQEKATELEKKYNVQTETNDTIQTVEDIDNQIIALEQQLENTEDDAEYEKIRQQISELEDRANQLEQQEIAPVQIASVEQTQQPTTQEVETNLPTDVVSNTQNIETNDSSIVENENSIYNKSNKEVVLDERGNGSRGINEVGIDVEGSKVQEANENISEREYTTKEWAEFEKRATATRKTELSEYEQKLSTDIKNNFNKEVVFFNDKNSKYLGGASVNQSDLIYVYSGENVSDRTKSFVAHHEVLESEISHNKNLNSKYIDVAIDEIINDEGFQQTKESFIGSQENLKNAPDRLIAKDIIVDIFTEQQTGINKGYDLSLSDTTLEVIDYNLQAFTNEAKNRRNVEGKSTQEDIAPIRQELAEMTKELVKTVKDTKKEVTKLNKELNEAKETIKELAEETKALTEADLPMVEQEALNNMKSATDEMAPVKEDTTPEYEFENDNEGSKTSVIDPMQDRTLEDVGNRKVKAYQYENPEVKPFFQDEARRMLNDLQNSVKGERMPIYDETGNMTYTGTTRQTTDDIASLLDSQYNYSYADIEKGLNAIIEDNGKENIAVAKRIEFALNDRLINGYTDITGTEIPPNQDYINLLRGKEYTSYYDSLEQSDIAPYEPTSEEVSNTDIAPVKNKPTIAEKNQAKLDTLNEEFEPSYEPVIEYLDNLEKRRQEKSNKKATQVELEDTTPMKEATKWQQAKTTLKTLFTNNKAVYDEIAKETGNKEIRYKADRLNTVSGETADITTAQLDNDFNPVGKSLNAIFENAESKGLGEASQDFLYHLSNMNRHKRGKGSAQYTAMDSQIFVEEFKKKYPKLSKQLLTDIHTWNKNRRNNLVDAGIISEQTSQLFEELDAEYVPFFEDRGYNPTYQSVGEIGTKNVVKYAKGGSKNVLPIKEAMIKQNMAERKAIAQNDLYKEVMKSYGKKAELGADVRLKAIDFSDSLYADSNGDKYLTAYVDGERKSVKITDFMYNNIQQAETIEKNIRNVEEQLSFVFKPLQAFSSYVRNIHTTWSPSFVITNPLKDIQDAPFNSTDAVKFVKNYKDSYTDVKYAKNLNKIAQDFKKITGQDITSIQDESQLKGKARDLYNNYEDGSLWNKFVAGYGSVKLYGDTYNNMDRVVARETQKASKDSKFKKMASVVPNINEFMELATRYAEFKTSIENGASLSEAFYNAKDVTTNFGRGGVITKALNRNGATFLNASVQGFSKFVRNFSGENGARGVVGSIAKAVTLGVLPAVFNHLAFGGDDEDEDYKALPDYIKDNYYLIKTDDGEFIRIPKGRALSVFGSAARRTLEYAEGEKDAFEGYAKNALSQAGPNNFLESNAFAPLIQAKNKETWYGGDLIPTRLQDKPVNEQYDESTDELSKMLGQTWLAKKLNVSPYQINYVLDQYTGGIGDFILPYMTEEANSDGRFLAPLKDKFTANSTMDNKYAGEFYDKMDELEVIANGENATEEDQLRSEYMSAVSWEMSALYKEKREVQNDSSLTKAEKYEKVKAIQKEINAIAENALNTYNTGTFGEYYSSIGDYEFNKYINKNGEEAWGTLYEDEAEELKEQGLTQQEYNDYFAMKQEFTNLNNDYYDEKDELEEIYGKDSDEYETASDELYWQKKNTIIDKIMNSNFSDETKAYVYNKYYSSDKIDVITTAGIDIDYLLDYDKNDFVADYNNKGKAITNSRKNKVIEYVNEYDLSIAEKAIIIKSKNTFKFNDYNYEIVDYVDNLDIPYEEKAYILKSLDMKVSEDGTISWE